MAEIVGIEITKPLPAEAVAGSTYKIEGSVKVFDAVGAPPFVYAEVKRKEWYKPEFAEEKEHIRGWPEPITGDFSIDFKPEKEGDYEVTPVATPAPLSLPAVGLFPILAKGDVMKVSVGQKPPAVFRFAGVSIDGNKVPLGNHDADSGLLIQKKTTDTLEIIPSYEWVGASKTATISIKAGYKDYLGNFTPKTEAYTHNIELPESPDTPYSGVLPEAIVIPLTACGDIGDGAIEVVAKLPGMGDYITRIWNVYATKAPVVSFRFSAIDIDGNRVDLTDHDADSGLLLTKTTADRLEVVPAFEWQGPRKTATISIKAGYKSALGFEPKSGAYTRSIELPESIETVYPGQLTSPISIQLTACGGLTDGALEVVLKISGVPDYITHIWNVYNTKAAEVIDFDLTRPTASPSEVNPGSTVTITCPVKSKCTKSQTVTAKVLIYEGSIYAGHGTLITTKTSSPFSIAPGESYDVIVHHTAVAGTIDRRDVEVEIYVGGTLIKESEWDDVYYVKAPEEVIDFDLTKPMASPSEVNPGSTVTITCPVKSKCTKSQTVTAKVLIYEGSIYAGHGTLITTKTSSPFSIAPGESYDVIVHHTAVAGTIDRRDVEVEIYVGGTLIKESEWDDVYYVKAPEEVIDFSLTRPTASPSEVSPGATVTITCPVTSKCTKSQTATAKVLIYEGSAYAGHGTLLATKSVSFSISPGQTYNAAISHTAVAGTIDRRDVEVEIYVGGTLIKESEWDDVYYVKVVEVYKGTISKKELEYNESRATIPAYNIPQNKRGLVHVWGRNDMATTQRMGTWWQVKNPAGTVVETYGVWEASPYTGAGSAHEFIGGRFTLDRVGTYAIDVVLYMNHDSPEIVQRYTGTLCTVVAAPVGISFKVSIWGTPSDFGSYQKWWAYYWDPGIGDFVSCGKWYSSSEKIPFNNVKPGGYLAVFLKRNSTVSSQYTSPTFQAVDGGIYQYDVQLGRVIKIG